MSLIERFKEKIDYKGGNGCWLWTAMKNEKGYGRIRTDISSNEGAHRYSYRINVGEIPEGMHVLHKCDNPSCVNPVHLFLGSNQDNVDDKMIKGRFNPNFGEVNGQSKLTRQQVAQIRFLGCTTLPQRHKNRISLSELGEKYKVNLSTISRILRNERWAVA